MSYTYTFQKIYANLYPSFYIQPEIGIFILTQEIKNIFVKELTSFLNWCKKVYKIKIPEVHTYTINDIDSPVPGKELIKIYSIKGGRRVEKRKQKESLKEAN